MSTGYLALVLHAHLPFVRHPEHEEFLEEDWFFEALTESYIPLLAMMERLVADGVPFQLAAISYIFLLTYRLSRRWQLVEEI